MSKVGMIGKSKTVKNSNNPVVEKKNPAYILRAFSAAGTGLNMSKNKKPAEVPKRTPSKKRTRRRRRV
jgi:hypothetical protein